MISNSLSAFCRKLFLTKCTNTLKFGQHVDTWSSCLGERLIRLADENGFQVRVPRESSKRGGTVAFDLPNAYRISRELNDKDFVIDYRDQKQESEFHLTFTRKTKSFTQSLRKLKKLTKQMLTKNT